MTNQIQARLHEAGQHGAAAAVAEHLLALEAQHAKHVEALEAENAHLQARVELLEAQAAKAQANRIVETPPPIAPSEPA